MTRSVYLAGGFYGSYKTEAIARLEEAGFDVLDPEQMENPRRVSVPASFVQRDLDAIDRADVLIAYQDSYPYVYGTAAEVGYAAARTVPVIYVCAAKRVDGFLSGLARATFTEMDAAVKFVIERFGPIRQTAVTDE